MTKGIKINPDPVADHVEYELYGEQYDSRGEYLSALAHEYKIGDKDYVRQKLEDEGYDLADIGQ